MADETEESNLICQLEEIEALASIYGEDFLAPSTDEKIFEIRIQMEDDSWWTVTIQVHFPPTYPSKEAPHFKLFSECLSSTEINEICASFNDLWDENFGQSIVYTWIKCMREQLLKHYNDAKLNNLGGDIPDGAEGNKFEFDLVRDMADSPMDSVKQVHFCVTEPTRIQDEYQETFVGKVVTEKMDEEIEFISGEPITDRKSTFQAHATHVVSEEQVRRALARLKENRKVAIASHNILAYRIAGATADNFLQDSDDDGETHAGGRLLHLLQILDARNVMVVVSRWYGGILLGPDRFKHINNCARTLLNEMGFTNRIMDKSGKATKDKKGSNKKLPKMKKK